MLMHFEVKKITHKNNYSSHKTYKRTFMHRENGKVENRHFTRFA